MRNQADRGVPPDAFLAPYLRVLRYQVNTYKGFSPRLTEAGNLA